MDHSEVSRIVQADAMMTFIAKLPVKRQARIRVVCGAIVEQGDPSGAVNRQFWSDQAHELALEIARKRAAA